MSPMAINDPMALASANGTSTLKTARKAWKAVPTSKIVKSIRNPIREVISGIDLSAPATGEKPFLNLGLGDPSVYGNVPPPPAALRAIEESLNSHKYDGYPQSVGYPCAQEAVASYFDEGENGSWRVTKRDVVMTHGASGALDMAFSVLAEEGKNVIFPRPLFTAYETLICSSGAEIRYYDLLPEQDWEVDLESLESQIDENTAFFVINNPSNPCGSNWSEGHLRQIAALQSRKQVVVVSDEVYAGMAWRVPGPRPAAADAPRVQGKFNRRMFTPYASVAADCPVLVLGAVSKRWLAPGWRTGWIITHDPFNVLSDVREGFGRWAFRIQGPSSTMQGALPAILANTPESFFDETHEILASVGQQLFDRLAKIPGLKPLLPSGAMYLMVGGITKANFPAFETDADFVAAFVKEENVLILPGACFRLEGYLRFVTTTPLPILLQACDRLEAFCARHRTS